MLCGGDEDAECPEGREGGGGEEHRGGNGGYAACGPGHSEAEVSAG